MSHKIDAALNHRASISERVQRLRAQLLSARPEVFDERGLLITDAYREALNEPAQMRRAKALDRILRKVHIQIKPDELIVGCKVPQPKGSPVYPEFNVQWLEDELDTLARRVLRAVGRFLEKATPEVSFEILGYHRLGIRKYEQIGRPYLLADMEAVSSEQLGQAKALLRAFNLTVV